MTATISKIELIQGEESILLLGTYMDGDLVVKRSCVTSMTFETAINKASATLVLQLKATRAKRYNTLTMTIGDAAANQRVLVYISDGESEHLAYDLVVSGYEESRSTATLTAIHNGINIAQTRTEYIVTTKADGTADLMSDILIPLIQSSLDNGKQLTVANGSSYHATVRDTHGLKDAIIYQAHGQLVGELIYHLLIATGGSNDNNAAAAYPVIMYADASDPDRVVLADFSCGSGSARTAPIELSVANGTIVSSVDLTKSSKESAINRAYFYRTVGAVYDANGNLISPGVTYKLYECIYEDTTKEYGTRSTIVSYPEWIDNGDGGTEILYQIGMGICRFNCRPQDTIKLTCDAKLILDQIKEPINQVYHVIDNSKSKDYGEMVCIGYTLSYPRMQITMTLAPNNPYIPSEMAETLSLTEQRLSALEAKTVNLTCELVSQIGTAAWSKVTVDCDKWMDVRTIQGLKHVVLFGDVQLGNKLPKDGIIAPDPANPADWVDYVSTVDGVDVSDHDHSGLSGMGNQIKFKDLNISEDLDLQHHSMINVTDLTVSGTGNFGSLNINGQAVATQQYISNLGHIRMADLNYVSVNVEPASSSRYRLGASNYRWSALYVDDVVCYTSAGYANGKSWANTGNNGWVTKAAVQDYVIDTISDVGSDKIVVDRTGSGTISNDTRYYDGCIRIGKGDGTKVAQICYGRSDVDSGINQKTMYYSSSFTYPPIVIALNERPGNSKEMGEFRSSYEFTTSYFKMYTDSSRIAYIAVGY